MRCIQLLTIKFSRDFIVQRTSITSGSLCYDYTDFEKPVTSAVIHEITSLCWCTCKDTTKLSLHVLDEGTTTQVCSKSNQDNNMDGTRWLPSNQRHIWLTIWSTYFWQLFETFERQTHSDAVRLTQNLGLIYIQQGPSPLSELSVWQNMSLMKIWNLELPPFEGTTPKI